MLSGQGFNQHEVLVVDREAGQWRNRHRHVAWHHLECHTTPDASDDEFRVYQHGPRRLWDEVKVAHDWWADHDKPGADRWRFTVIP